MTRRLDPDVRAMTPGQLRQEVMRLRGAFRTELNNTGNRRCWVNLLRALPEGKAIREVSLLREEFLGNRAIYYDRNQRGASK
ncbi:MAG: hypothetical protein Q7S95_00950 [bacterium]|nr:hypothetical protein [bacterium]